MRAKDVRWYVLRIRHSSVKRITDLQGALDGEDTVEQTYVPTAFLKVAKDKMDFVPTVVNYIYVQSTFNNLKAIKTQYPFEPLRFVMHPVFDENYNKLFEPLCVTDKQMHDFIRVTQEENDKVVFLSNLDYACRPSQGVQIIDGQFAGVVGRIKRIKGNRCVVIPIGKEIAVAITGLARNQLRALTDQELQAEEQTSTAMQQHE